VTPYVSHLATNSPSFLCDRGQPVRDHNFLLLMNAHHEEIPFILPALPSNAGWFAMLDTSCLTSRHPDAFYHGSGAYPLQARSLALVVERPSNGIRVTDRRRTDAA
jgi:hypothetical protein